MTQAAANENFQTWEQHQKKSGAATGGNGGYRSWAAGANTTPQAPGQVFQTWEQHQGKNGAGAPQPLTAPAGEGYQSWEQYQAKQASQPSQLTPAPLTAPVGQGEALRSFRLKPGSKAVLRAAIASTLARAGELAQSFLDAIVEEQATEAPPANPAEPSPSAGSAPNWERFGFGVQFAGDVAEVTHVLGGSPAERAGLEVGDRLVQIEDQAPKTASDLEAGIRKGEKWAFHRLVINRNGAQIPLSMTKE